MASYIMAMGLLQLASVYLLCTQLLVQAQQDWTTDPEIVESGTNLFDVAEEVVIQIQRSSLFPEIPSRSEVLGTNGFLRLLAFVETQDGEQFPKGVSGGLWNVRSHRLRGAMDFFFERTYYFDNVIATFIGFNPGMLVGLDNAAQSTLNSAVFALMHIANQMNNNLSMIPADRTEWASFYANYYSPVADPNITTRQEFEVTFNTAVGSFEEYSRNISRQRICGEKADVIVLLDSSGSIGSEAFQIALNAVAQLAALYPIGEDATRFGVVPYSHVVSDGIMLNQTYDLTTLNTTIREIPYSRGGTLTGAAINFTSDIGFSESFGARPRSEGLARILIVVTDGRSFDNAVSAGEMAINEGINVFSIGIGDGPDDMELLGIAGSDSEHVFQTPDYNQLIHLTGAVQVATCRSQVTVGDATLIQTTIDENEFRYLKLEIPMVCGQSLNISVFVNSTTGYLVVYVSSRFRNPNERLHDRRLEFGPGDMVSLTSVNEDSAACSRMRRQAQTDPQQQFLYLGVIAMNGSASLALQSTIMATPEDRILSSGITELTRTEDILSYSCAATCSCPNAYVTWEVDAYNSALPSAAQVTVSQDGRQANLTLNISEPGYSGSYACVVHSTNVLTPARITVEVPLNCENNGTNIGLHLCVCPPGWTGFVCEQFLCSPECQNGGSCIGPQQCSCLDGWAGSSCGTALCDEECVNGVCSTPNTCTCFLGWTGDTCSKECPDLSLDLVLAMDASFSLEDESFQMVKDFAAALLDNFTLGEDVRVSVISFGFEVLTDMHLTNILTKDATQNKIRRLSRPGHFRATRISRVLQVAANEFIDHGRFHADVIHVMVLLTDGVLTDKPFLQQALDRAQKEGFIRYAVGVPPLEEVAMNELYVIAGDPSRVFLSSAEGLQELKGLLSRCQACGHC